MPWSSSEGKHDAMSWIRDMEASSFLDVGTGAGYWCGLLRTLPRPTFVAGIEIWAPYVEEFELRKKYNELILSDARVVLRDMAVKGAKYDVVILGDVIEHMGVEDARILWRDSLRVAKEAVILSIPTVHYPQEIINGNPYEAHVTDNWSVDSVLSTFPGINAWSEGQEVSVFMAKTW